METNENYEELKWTAKSFFQFVTSNRMYYIIFQIIVALIVIKIIDIIFTKILIRGKKSVQMSFLKGCLQVIVVIATGISIASLFDVFKNFASQILLSSSLLVVVLGFVFQEGLSNIVHGFILSTFTPFQLGDRIHVTIDGESITGYVKSIDLRHTVIENVMNASHVIVPNSKMDLSVIDNNYYADSFSSNFLDVDITYESNLTKAIEVMADLIDDHPMVKKAKKSRGINDRTIVLIRELGPSGISLRASVVTSNVEENFVACSDIRRDLVLLFKSEADLEIAYPHLQVVEA
ncbi:MAG: mechanosensitive ion channel family protein [Lachnospiraceae bacterium]|nr:mechanosensitive ion channel family protein [Lachnospiraceae bacterium]